MSKQTHADLLSQFLKNNPNIKNKFEKIQVEMDSAPVKTQEQVQKEEERK